MTEKNSPPRPVGYARVSTYGQTLDAQLEQLRGARLPTRRLNTVVEREGVNYVCGVVESNNSVFKEQDLRHDYGHDAFVLLVEGEKVLPKEIAMQIKSGTSYCTPTGCRIPATGSQLNFWAKHDLETLGVVYDPAEGAAYWVDLKAESQQRTACRQGETGAVIEFPKCAWNRFDALMFREFLVPVLQGKAPTVSLDVALEWARSSDFQTHDIGVRTLAARHKTEPATWDLLFDLFSSRPAEDLCTRLAIAIAQIMGHSDIGYYSEEVPEEVRRPIRARILRFSAEEIGKILSFCDDGEGLERGSTIYSLLSVIGARPDSPEILRSIRDSDAYDKAIRDRAAGLYRVCREDPEWWNFWRRNA